MEKQLISQEEFNALSTEEQKTVLSVARDQFGASYIIEQWGVSRNKFYSILKDLGIETKKRSKTKPGRKEETEDKGGLNFMVPETDHFLISYGGVLSGENIKEVLLSMLSILQDTNSQYLVKLEIKQK